MASVRNLNAYPAAEWTDELRSTLALAWPLIVANLTQQAIQATDVLLLGQLGALPLAAATIALNLTFTLNLLLFGLLLASSPMMATALGKTANARRSVRRTFRAGMWLLALAMPVYWLLLWNSQSIMLALGQPAELAAGGQTYLRAYMWCTAPWLLFQLLRNFAAALERPQVILWLSAGAIAVNALLSWALIFGRLGLPALGIAGAGLGSTLTWLIACLALVLIVQSDHQFARFRLFQRFWRFDPERILAMVRLGWPIGLTMALEMGVFALAAAFMGWIGSPAVAAHAVALQIASLSFMVPLGLGQAATVRVGLALGRNDPAAITRAGWTAWLLGVGFMAAMALLLWLYPRELVGLFFGPSVGAETRDLAVAFLAIAAAFQIVDGAQVIGAGMLRGLHDTRWPLVFALVGYWVFGLGIGAWLAFSRDWQGVGIWVGLAAGLGSVALLMLGRWLLRERLGLTHCAAT